MNEKGEKLSQNIFSIYLFIGMIHTLKQSNFLQSFSQIGKTKVQI